MTPKTLLIISVDDLKNVGNLAIPPRVAFSSSIILLQDKTHFRALKNRWSNTYDHEIIPNRLLRAYLTPFEGFISTADVLDSWLGES